MKIEWDFSEFTDFAKGLQEEYSRDTALMTATQNIAKVLHKELLTLTPVDTGNLRKMWSAGDNLRFTVEVVSGGYEVTLINEAVNKRSNPEGFMYGVAVNDGHKTTTGGWVMGKFFVENSINKVTESKVIERIVYNELQKWWRGV